MRKLFVIALLAIFMVSCSITPSQDFAEFEFYALTSYYMLADNAVATRAAINVTGNTGGFEGGVVENYPEMGQTTTYSVVDLGSDFYQITSVTTYPSGSPVYQTFEEYRIWDMNQDGVWNEDDPIVDNNNNVDSKYRFQFDTYLTDATRRRDVIIEDLATDGVNYIEATIGEYDFPSDESEMDESFQTMQWSSKVAYYQVVPFWSNTNFWTTWNTKRIIGLRYYSEYVNGDGDLVQSYTIFEKMVDGSVGVDDATPENIFGDSGLTELAEFRMNVLIVDGVKTIDGKWFLYQTNRVKQTIVLQDGVVLEVVN
jgi:hypothetical protein